MKYLQTYESFKNPEFDGIVQDIFVDISEDENIVVKTTFHKVDGEKVIVRIKKKQTGGWEQQFLLSSELVKTIIFCVNYLSENGLELEAMFTEDEVEVIEIPIKNSKLEVPEGVDVKYSVDLKQYLDSLKDDNRFNLIDLEFKIVKA